MAIITGTIFNDDGTDLLFPALDGTNDNDVISGLQGNDNLFGHDGNDSLDGGADNDTLNGGNGNDFLDGGTGVDAMNGGDNDDTYIVDNVGDTAFEVFNDALGGVDTVNSSVTFALSRALENLNLTGTANINGTGNSNKNLINGNSANNTLSGLDGNDTLNGGLGNDTLNGGNGNDTLTDAFGSLGGADVLDGGAGADKMNGGDGNDTYFVDDAGDVVSETFSDTIGGIDTVNSLVSFTLSTSLENLTLTGADNINGTGNAKGNVINGNSGNNILNGLDGNDTLYGGLGNDTLDGGTGIDTMNGFDGNDTYIVDDIGDLITGEIDDSTGGTADLVNASVTYALVAAMENLTLTGLAAINGTGNAKGNIINGNSANNTIDGLDGNDKLNGGNGKDVLNGGNGNDALNGGAGADVMTGGLGNDTYSVNAVTDSVVEAAGVASGTDLVSSSINYTLGANLENLTLTGATNINGTGNTLNNTIRGNSGANVLSGNNGNDNLIANGGNDTLLGGIGNDTLQGGLGNDTLNSGAGNDTFSFNTALGAGNVDTIQDFNVVNDTIRLENSIFTSVGAAGPLDAAMFNTSGLQDANDIILYNTTTGALSYDADANGAGVSVHFATVVGIPPLTAVDFVVV